MISSGLCVNNWIDSPEQCPSVDMLRPIVCSHCDGVSDGLGFHGHGTVVRLLRVLIGSSAAVLELLVRRYKCCACGHTVTVGPREMRPRHRYGLALIAFILASWSLDGRHPKSLRARFCDESGELSSTYERWPVLRQWGQKMEALFGCRVPPQGGVSIRKWAGGVTSWLDGHCPPEFGSDKRPFRVAQAVRLIDL